MNTCIVCHGTGWERIKRPCKMYKNQAVDTVRKCRNCGGKGTVSVAVDGKSLAAGEVR